MPIDLTNSVVCNVCGRPWGSEEHTTAACVKRLQDALAAERARAGKASYLSFELRQGLAKMAEYYHESQGHRVRLEACPDAVCTGVRQNCRATDDFLEQPTVDDTPDPQA